MANSFLDVHNRVCFQVLHPKIHSNKSNKLCWLSIVHCNEFNTYSKFIMILSREIGLYKVLFTVACTKPHAV